MVNGIHFNSSRIESMLQIPRHPLFISNCFVSCFYDKPEGFDFDIVNVSFLDGDVPRRLDGDVPRRTSYEVF